MLELLMDLLLISGDSPSSRRKKNSLGLARKVPKKAQHPVVVRYEKIGA